MIYGYIRVSSDKQTTKNQHFEIEKFCLRHGIQVDKWIEETISGTKQVETESLTSVDAEARARAKADSSYFGTQLKDAQKAYEKAAAKKGTSNSAAKEAFEKQISGAKDDLKRIADDLAKKCKTGGTKTWIAAGIGTVALGLAGLALRPKAKEA